jgi:hypothetical protein
MKSVNLSPLLLLIILPAALGALVLPADYPFAPAAGEPGSTAVAAMDPRFAVWAVNVVRIDHGSDVDETFRDPAMALGPPRGTSMGVLSLGRGGSVVLAFENGIPDGEGDDFAVFENAFSDDFLELAWVEVSSDGVHFVRFPHYSATAAPVGAFGGVDPQQVHGFAGKYRQGYGTPFDLQDLAAAHALVIAGEAPFSNAYQQHLRDSFPRLDLDAVQFLRLVDVVGDGRSVSALADASGEGFPVYDPFPTVGSAGFDLDAVGIFHHRAERATFTGFARRQGLSGDPSDDADRDGDPDGLEFLLGSDPIDPSSKRHYRFVPSAETGGLLVEILRRPEALGQLRLRGSPDLDRWESVQVRIEPLDLPTDATGELEAFRMEVDSDGDLRFWILEAVLTAE